MALQEERMSWLEFIVLLTVAVAVIVLLLFLFTGIAPMDVPEIFSKGALLERMHRDIAALKLAVPPDTAIILGLSVLSGSAFAKSFI